MENIGIRAFQNIAVGKQRDVLLTTDGTALRKGSFWRTSLRQSHKQENVEVMNHFRMALKNEYGVFGEQAFDHVMTTRSSMRKSLRTSDVRQVLEEATGKARFVSLNSEGVRQMTIHPKFARKDLSVSDREDIGNAYRNLLSRFEEGKPLPQGLQDISANQGMWKEKLAHAKSVEELSPLAERFLEEALKSVEDGKNWAHEFSGVGDGGHTVPASAPGLGKMGGLSMGGTETSVEDRISAGTVGRGMTLNPGSLNPYILDSLKDKGVEPGFVAHHDWSAADTRSYMSTPDEAALRQEVFVAQHPGAKAAEMPADYMADGAALRKAAMKLGEKNGSYMALLGEKIIATALQDTDSNLHQTMTKCLDRAVRNMGQQQLGADMKNELIARFSGTGRSEAAMIDEETLQGLAREMKLEAFSTVRRAIMSGSSLVSAKNETVRRFQERVIVKLDYNQSDRVSPHGALRKPLRCTQKQGYLYRGFCLHTIGGTNAGAVGEVLANDLTRLTGVQTQELSLVRGQYKNGATKLLLEGKMAVGYKDFDTCLVDGRLVMPKNGQVNHLGSYKAGFVLLGDRDSIGSKGQNKGFIGNEFFAIDPGHSLENSDIGLKEDFSLKGSSTKTFKNFSVFDDTTRADKFQGILRIRDMDRKGTDVTLFSQYENQFAQEADKGLRSTAQKRIAEMKSEFMQRKNDILTTFKHQLDTYDKVSSRFDSVDLANQAIEMEANLSKILSTTTMKSANGEVDLRHLEVCHDAHEVQFRGKVSADGSELVYESIGTMSSGDQAEAMKTLGDYGLGSGAGIRTDGQRLQVAVRLDDSEAVAGRFKAFDESQVMMRKHMRELTNRVCTNLGKLTSPTALDGEGRHLVMTSGAGRHDWSVTPQGDDHYQFSCPVSGREADAVRSSLEGYLSPRGMGNLPFGETSEGTFNLLLSSAEAMALYRQLDENAIINHKG